MLCIQRKLQLLLFFTRFTERRLGWSTHAWPSHYRNRCWNRHLNRTRVVSILLSITS